MPYQSTQEVKTTETSIILLKKIRDSNGASVTELEEELDMAKSAIYKHIKTLVEHGFIIKAGSEYKLGFELFHLGKCVQRSVLSPDKIEVAISDLRSEVDHHVEFGVESSGLLVVYDAPTTHGESLPYTFDAYHPHGFHAIAERNKGEPSDYVGNKAYLHNNAMGKAILATKPRKEIDKIVDKYGLPCQTDETISSREELYKEVKKIRDRGFATTNNEWTNGLKEVAVAVEVVEGKPLGALNICGPSYEISSEEMFEIFPKMLKAAASKFENDLINEVEME